MHEVDDDDAISALLRMDFLFFLRFAIRELGGDGPYLHNWHIDAIIEQLRRMEVKEISLFLLTLPPRSLKSRLVIAWEAWMLGRNPSLSFMSVSYGQSLAEDHARDCLKLMDSYWYRRAFPGLVLTRRAVDRLETSAGGKRMAESIEGGITGFGADIIIIDDPMKAQDTFSQAARDKVIKTFDDTLMQRFNDPERPRIIVVMQRLHEADLVGTLKDREGWHELCLPAIATRDERIAVGNGRYYQRREGCALHPARHSLKELLKRKAANPWVFASQFQQEPVPEVGNIIEAKWLQYHDPAALDLGYGQLVMSLDTASKDNPFNDYSAFVIALVQGSRIHVIDVVRARLQFPELKAKTIELARLYNVRDILIEDAASGQQLIQALRAEQPSGVPLPIARRPEGDKLSRVFGVSGMIQSERLYLPEKAPWLADFISELIGFPGGTL